MTGLTNGSGVQPGMRTWAAVPFRGRTGKRRLAGILTDEERAALVDALLGDVLDALTAVPEIERVLVVAPAGTPLPDSYGEHVALLDEPPPSLGDALNAAVAHAQGAAEAAGVARLLVVPADLPLLGADDVHALLGRSDRLAAAPHVVVAPDAAEQGTNALLLHPPTAIAPTFGRDSFVGHRRRAREREIEVGVVHTDSLALDLDTPAHLARLLASSADGRTLAVIRSLALDERLGLSLVSR